MRKQVQWRVSLVLTLATGALSACGSAVVEPVCGLGPTPTVKVYVRDSVSNRFIASGATLDARDTTYRIQISTFDRNRPDLDSFPIRMGATAAGPWKLTLTRASYAPWTREIVVVLRGCLEVDPQTITARMQPAP